MKDVELFSMQDLERHAAAEVERAVSADRKIQREKRRAARWSSFKWLHAWVAIVLVVVLMAGAGIWYTYAIRPTPEPSDRVEFIDSQCFKFDGELYCAEIRKQYN